MTSHRRPTLRDVTDHVICPLCQGYIIDATAVNCCLHLFCRTCLVQHLASGNGTCPKCGIQVKDEADDCIRRDHLMQRIIYKLIPHLLTRELQSRRDFLKTSCDVNTTSSRDILPLDSQAMTGLYADSDDISICVRLMGESCINASDELLRSRYLLCPANTTVGLVKKFIHSKFDLNAEKHQVEIFYAGQLLTSCSTLIDVAYSFDWDKTDPLMLDYVIVSCQASRPLCTSDVALVTSAGKSRKRKSDTSKPSTNDVVGDEVKLVLNDRKSKSSRGADEKCNSDETVELVKTNMENDVQADDKSAEENKDSKDNTVQMNEDTRHASVSDTVAATNSETNSTSRSAIMLRIPRPLCVLKRHTKKTKCRSKHRTNRKKQSPTSATTSESDIQQQSNGTSSVAAAVSLPSLPTASTASVARTPAATQQTLASSVSRSNGCSDDDSCVSISTSVTVVISRRASGTAAATSASTGNGNDVTVETGSGTDSSRQFVVNTKIPKVSITTSTDIQPPSTKIAVAPEQREPVAVVGAKPSDEQQCSSDDVTSVLDQHDEVRRPMATVSDALKRANQKRKSLESVIKALKPTAIVLATSAASDDQPAASPAAADDVGRSSQAVVGHKQPASVDEPSKDAKDADKSCQVIDLSVPTARTSCDASLVEDLRSDKRRYHHDDSAWPPTVHGKTAASVVPHVSGISPSEGATLAAVSRCTHGPTSAPRGICLEDSLRTKYRFIPPAVAPSFQHRHGNSLLGDGYDTPLELTTKGK